jgi:hypothetical protein
LRIRTTVIERLEKEHGRPFEAILKDLFWKHQTQTAVAKQIGVSQGYLWLLLQSHGLTTRTILVNNDETEDISA